MTLGRNPPYPDQSTAAILLLSKTPILYGYVPRPVQLAKTSLTRSRSKETCAILLIVGRTKTQLPLDISSVELCAIAIPTASGVFPCKPSACQRAETRDVIFVGVKNGAIPVMAIPYFLAVG